jgi:hypothetical protein
MITSYFTTENNCEKYLSSPENFGFQDNPAQMKTGLRFVPGLVDLQRNGHEKRKEEIKIV